MYGKTSLFLSGIMTKALIYFAENSVQPLHHSFSETFHVFQNISRDHSKDSALKSLFFPLFLKKKKELQVRTSAYI